MKLIKVTKFLDYTQVWFNMDYDSDILGVFIRRIGCTDKHYLLGFLDRGQNELEFRHFNSQSEAEKCLELFIQAFSKAQDLGY